MDCWCRPWAAVSSPSPRPGREKGLRWPPAGPRTRQATRAGFRGLVRSGHRGCPTGFTIWLAGDGVRGGQVIGRTDQLGLRAVEDRLYIHDLHAAILNLLGLDHRKLIYRQQGRPEWPTLNEGDAGTDYAVKDFSRVPNAGMLYPYVGVAANRILGTRG